MIILYLLIPVVLFLLIFFCFPYLFGYYIYPVKQENIYNYNKNTLLYIKKNNKTIKKNTLIIINKKICRVISVRNSEIVFREDESSDITIKTINDGIDTVKFSIPKIGIVLSLANNIKKKVKKK